MSRQYAINGLPVEAIAPTLLASAEREASPGNTAGWEQSSGEDVGAQVHVMMAVYPLRDIAIEPDVLLNLGRDKVFEWSLEPRMKECRRQTMSPQTGRNSFLHFHNPSGATWPGKSSGKVQVKAGIDRSVAS